MVEVGFNVSSAAVRHQLYMSTTALLYCTVNVTELCYILFYGDVVETYPQKMFPF